MIWKNNEMLCDERDCPEQATHTTSKWLTPSWLTVEYWCKKHAPPDAEVFEE